VLEVSALIALILRNIHVFVCLLSCASLTKIICSVSQLVTSCSQYFAVINNMMSVIDISLGEAAVCTARKVCCTWW